MKKRGLDNEFMLLEIDFLGIPVGGDKMRVLCCCEEAEPVHFLPNYNMSLICFAFYGNIFEEGISVNMRVLEENLNVIDRYDVLLIEGREIGQFLDVIYPGILKHDIKVVILDTGGICKTLEAGSESKYKDLVLALMNKASLIIPLTSFPVEPYAELVDTPVEKHVPVPLPDNWISRERFGLEEPVGNFKDAILCASHTNFRELGFLGISTLLEVSKNHNLHMLKRKIEQPEHEVWDKYDIWDKVKLFDTVHHKDFVPFIAQYPVVFQVEVERPSTGRIAIDSALARTVSIKANAPYQDIYYPKTRLTWYDFFDKFDEMVEYALDNREELVAYAEEQLQKSTLQAVRDVVFKYL